jgi:4-hydroxyphenylpyruvate 3-dimethylallyltransferase
VLDAFANHFATSAVLWKTTDRPADSLSYRFYSAGASDTLAPAITAGLVDPNHKLLPILQSWISLYDGTAEQSCDFDSDGGLAKTWLYLGGTKPLAEALAADGVPATIGKHGERLRSLGLTHVRFVSVDYRNGSVNLYFRAPGPITAAKAAQIVALAGAVPPSPRRFGELQELLPSNAYTLAVTVAADTGAIQRVCFYAPMLSSTRLPDVGDRLSRFFALAPCEDKEEVNVAAWSFGTGGGTYLKGERAWFGNLAGTFRRWATFFTGDSDVDPVLT